MAYRVHQTNKESGVTYVYEAVSCWDKEKQQSRNKQVCIGKLDRKTGAFVPSKRLNPEQAAVRDPAVTATALVAGPGMILGSIVEELKLGKILKACFPTFWQQIPCMAYYIAQRGAPLSHCEAWSKSHVHPFGSALTSQRISDILKSLDSDGRQTFFSRWGKKVLERDYLCYDITSVSSYTEQNEYAKHGYNRDGDKLRQVNFALLAGQKNQLPVYYERLPGNISDVSTLHRFLRTFDYLNLPRLHLVLDKGFYSQKNVDELLESRDKFIIAAPNGLKWVQKIIDENRQSIQNPEGYRKQEGEILYVRTKLYPWGDMRRRCYVHLYYNSFIAATTFNDFTEELLACKQELETDNLVIAHEDMYKTFFTIKETPVRGRRVLFNNEVIEQYRNRYAGFYVILTNDIKIPMEALRVYRDKDTIEKCFDDLKNQLDMKRLRVQSSTAMDGRFFVQFIALILTSALRKKMRDNGLIEKYTPRELLMEMETLTQIRYSGRYGQILTEITKPQREILETLKVPVQT